MSEQEKDPFIGETFQDKDSRSAGRRIKIVDKAPATRFRREGYYYRYVNVYGEFVGPKRRHRVTVATLHRQYRKVSH